jgi:hypothetical protein
MRELCINCGGLLGPVLISLGLIIWGLSTKVINWSDLKDRNNIIPEIGIIVLALAFVWMFVHIFEYEEIDYLQLFAPAFIGLAVTGAGVYRLRTDINFTGLDYAYAGIALYGGSLFWIFWVFQAFS